MKEIIWFSLSITSERVAGQNYEQSDYVILSIRKGENKINELYSLSRFFSIKRVLLEFFEDDNEQCCDIRTLSKIELVSEEG